MEILGISNLSWDVANAQQVSMRPGYASVKSSGNKRVSPSATITYCLTAKNAAGEKTKRITVEVIKPPQKKCTISGRVTGEKRFVKAIAVYTPDFRKLVSEVLVDSNGQFRFSNLPVSEYKVVPLSKGKFELLSSPKNKHIRCKGDESYTVNFHIEGISEG